MKPIEAERAKVPVVPVTIVGTRDIIRKGSIHIYPNVVRIIISPYVTIDGEKKKKGGEILQDIRKTICSNFKPE